jgi:hypothetical protein
MIGKDERQQTSSIPSRGNTADYAHIDTSDTTVRLSPGTSHTLLKPIGSSTGQHLVDSDDVEGVGPDPQVERVLSRGLDDVLVAANTGSFQSL